jgi:hypothetical protein
MRFFGRLFNGDSTAAVIVRAIAIGGFGREAKFALDSDSDVLIDRAGVSLFFLHAELGQQLENPVRLNFKLTRQLVDPDLQLHR